MIFTRVISALLISAASAQALYIPEALYVREFEESRDVAARELSDHLNVVRDLASNNIVLAARGNEDHHPHGGGESKKTHPVSPGEITRKGQKVQPPGIRIGITRNWESGWHTDKKDGKK